MQVRYPTTSELGAMLLRQRRLVERERAELANDEALLAELQKALQEALDREAKGLPTGVYVEEP